MRKKRLLFWVVGVILLLIAAGSMLQVIASPAIEAVHPVRGPALQAVYATGTVEATVMMPIAARSPARLMQLFVDEGTQVTKDQPLAQLEDDDLQHQMEELAAREKFAHDDYQRKAKLVARGYEAKATADQAKSDWEAAKAAVARATDEAGYMKLTAPADGLIIKRDGEVGQMIPAGEPVFWLSCCAPLRISAEVDEEDISQVQNGQEVLIRADAFPGEIFHGKVQSITPKGDPVARSYRVRIEFTDPNPLHIGMTAETNIIASKTDNALLIPTSALAKDKIWLVEDGRLVNKPVTIGAQGPLQAEIKSGLDENSLVVLNPAATLKPGARVRATLVEQPH